MVRGTRPARSSEGMLAVLDDPSITEIRGRTVYAIAFVGFTEMHG